MTPMDRDPGDVRQDRLFLGAMGWGEVRDGFERPTPPSELLSPEAKQFLDHLMAVAAEAGALGLWETPRALMRLRDFAIAEIRAKETR